MKYITQLLTSAALISSFTPVSAASFYWDPISGGNGHYYEAAPSSAALSWSAAKTEAETRGGYLATITSNEENQFVYSLINSSTYWNENNSFGFSDGPWIGLYQTDKTAEPAGNYAWVTGESVTFTAWHGSPVIQPDDNNGNEEYVGFWTGNPARGETWNDYPAEYTSGYVIEFNAVPEPSTYAFFAGIGLIAFATYRRTTKLR